MNQQTPPSIIELESPFPTELGLLKLLEPPDADRAQLIERILCGLYEKPFVIDDGFSRTLYFSLAYIQSAMRIKDPLALELAYTRKMMGFLLFINQPRNILMLGLGGGSLAKFCHRHLPLAQITVVEIDPHVVAFRELFEIPPDGPRFRVLVGDAALHVAGDAGSPDVIMTDAFDRHGFATSVCSRDFYANVHASLARRGVMVANLAGQREERIAHLGMIREVFADNVLVLPIQDDGNHVAFAFRDPTFEPRWRWIESQAKALGSRYGLDFPKFAKKLERSRKLGYVERTLVFDGFF